MTQGFDAGAYHERIKAATTEKSESSQQLQKEKFANARGKSLSPPYSPKKLASLIEVNTTHAKAGFSKARNVAGYGFDIVPHPGVENPDETQRQVAESFWFGNESKWQVGPMSSELATVNDVLQMAWADYEFIGWLSLEVLVSLDGTPTGLAYIPAPSIRKRKDLPGFVQLKGGDLRYFGSFGDRYGNDKVFVDANTGDASSSVDNVANELVFKRNHTPFVDHYGTPDIIPAIPNITGDDAARDYNVDFFTHNAVPRMAIIVEGGQLTEGAREDIHKVMHDMRDADHRTIVLEVEKLLDNPGAVDINDDENLRIRVEPITVGIEEDASFLDYHDYNEHEILKAHEVPPVEAGQIKSGAFSTDAQEQRRGYIETVIKPKQESLAQLLFETVHSALGITDYVPQFRTRGVDTSLLDAEAAKTQVDAVGEAMMVDEARALFDLEPLGEPVGNMLLSELSTQSSIGQSVQAMVSRMQRQARTEEMTRAD